MKKTITERPTEVHSLLDVLRAQPPAGDAEFIAAASRLLDLFMGANADQRVSLDEVA